MTLRASSNLARRCAACLALPGLMLAVLAADGRGAEDKATYQVEAVQGLESKDELFAVRAIDAKACIVVGGKGFIARSADGGATWTAVKSRTTAALRDVRFVTPQLGLAVGDGGDYAVPDIKKDSDLNDLRARAKASSHVVSGGQCWSTVLRTDNGGKSWMRYEPATNLNINRVIWLDRRRAVAVTGYFNGDPASSDGSILSSEDAGKTWKMLYTLGSACRSIAVASDNSGWVVGPPGRKPGRMTYNGRQLNSIKDLTPQEQRFLPADFKRPLQVPETWNATSVSLTVFNRERVNADSLTVNATEGVGRAPILWDTCVQGNQSWVVGEDGLLASAERRGKKWLAWKAVELKDADKVGLRAVTFRDAKTGLVVGEKGTCFATTDGGKTWERVDTKTTENLNGVQFMGASAVVVGENGTAFRLVRPQ